MLWHRRLQITETVTWEGIALHLSVGFTREAAAGEIFAEPVKSNRTLDLSMQDDSIAVSHLLDGRTLDEVRRIFTPLPDALSSTAPSFIAFIIDRALQIETRVQRGEFEWSARRKSPPSGAIAPLKAEITAQLETLMRPRLHASRETSPVEAVP